MHRPRPITLTTLGTVVERSIAYEKPSRLNNPPAIDAIAPAIGSPAASRPPNTNTMTIRLTGSATASPVPRSVFTCWLIAWMSASVPPTRPVAPGCCAATSSTTRSSRSSTALTAASLRSAGRPGLTWTTTSTARPSAATSGERPGTAPAVAARVSGRPAASVYGCATLRTSGRRPRSAAAARTAVRTAGAAGSTPSSTSCTDGPDGAARASRSCPVRAGPGTCGASSETRRSKSASLPKAPETAPKPTTVSTTQASRNQRAWRAITRPRARSTGPGSQVLPGGGPRVSVAVVSDLFSRDPLDAVDDVDDARDAGEPGRAVAPLAVRMRPRTVDELVGQDHLLGPGAPLRRLAEGSGGRAGP